jgi:hypothetical protein
VAPRNEVSSWLKPAAAGRRLGLSLFKLKRLADAGDLVASKDFYGALRFDPVPVETLRRRMDAQGKVAERPSSPGRPRTATGRDHARVFRLFGEGRELREIVMECELTTDTVVELRRQYAELGRDLLVSPKGLVELRELLDWTTEPTERNLLAAVAARNRRQFERGMKAAAETDNHTTEEETSGKLDPRAAGPSRRAHEKSKGSLRRDLESESAD